MAQPVKHRLDHLPSEPSAALMVLLCKAGMLADTLTCILGLSEFLRCGYLSQSTTAVVEESRESDAGFSISLSVFFVRAFAHSCPECKDRRRVTWPAELVLLYVSCGGLPLTSTIRTQALSWRW